MMPNQGPAAPSKAIAFWVIWGGILSGLNVIQMVVGGGIPSGKDQGSAPLPLVGVCVAAAFASMLVRFVILPLKKTLEQKMAMMIVGLAMAEACGIVSAIVIPPQFAQTRLWLFITAVTCVLVSAPVYARDRPRDGGYLK